MRNGPASAASNRDHTGWPLQYTLALWFAVVAVVSSLSVGALTYVLRSEGLRNLIDQQLSLVRNDKARDVETWFQERKDDTQMWAEAPGIVETVEAHAAGQAIPETGLRTEQLEQIRATYHCHSVLLVDAATGRTILHGGPRDAYHPELPADIRDRVLAERRTIHTDVFICPLHHNATLIFAAPVLSSTDKAKAIGIIAFYMDLQSWFYPRVLQTEQVGRTGEVLLVNREGLAQSPLRDVENAPARARLAAEPARRAAAGLTGTITANDYYSTPVLAGYGFLPEVGWGIVVKQDLAEINAPVRQMAVQIAVLILGAVVLASLASILVARKIAAPAAGIAQASERIRQGDLDVRAPGAGPQEIRTIARNFNGMMDQLGRQFRKGDALGAIFASASAHNRLGALVSELLPGLMHHTRSQSGVFFLTAGESGEFRRLVAYGVPENRIAEAIHLSPPDHLLAEAAAEANVKLVSGLTDRHDLQIVTQSGSTRPAALLCIPLVHSGKPIAIIGLASLHDYRPEDLDVAETVSLSLGQSIAAALTNEKNISMAEELRTNNEELTAANEELQSQTEELQQQSEELHQQTEELARQRAAVEEADRLKSQFLSNMSHELRTPLNSILALSQLMLARGTGVNPEKESEYLKIVERNGRHLLNLINDILDLSKIESGRMDISPTVFRPEHVVHRALEVARPLAEAKGLAIEFQPEPVPTVQSDEDKVHQILLNLLSNAVKFTDVGKISLSVRSRGDRVLFEVRDTGIGIGPSEVRTIFDEFRQVDGSTTRRHEGTGLGLAIGQKLAKLLGGEITVEATPGAGSTFTLSLPCRITAAPSTTASRPSTPSAGLPRPAKTILVVDDDPSVRQLLQNYLTESGYEVVAAANGREAVRLARERRPYAMTLDVLMPDMDGWEVIRELKAQPSTASIPILVISVTEDRATALALGASGFLLKPVDKNILARELERIARSRPLKHVLVVDDDASTRQHLALMLEDRCEQISLADGGRQALDLIRTSPPDAIVLDLMMPDMDGFTVLERLRSDPATRDIPVLILTAKDLAGSERDRLRQAVSQIITKGTMDRDRLLHELEQTLAELDRQDTPEAPPESATVLVVDDDEIAAIQISSALEDAGYRATVARSGQEALDGVRETVPDAVVLDIMMPGMDGFEVLRQLRSLPETSAVPVLILTAKEVTAEERHRLAGARVRQLIQKGSVDRDHLISAVRDLLAAATGSPHASPAHRPAGPAPAAPAGPAEEDGLILVVEDNPDNLVTIGAVLDDLGREHAHATDGEQAIEMVRRLRPRLVLMDMQLPVLSGLDAVRRIKADPELAAIPVVALTAKAMRGDREAILAAGCEDYMAKPLDRAELARMLAKWASDRS